jgi:hypothetical protein
MSTLERMLLENMLRFGPKNLTEWDQRRLKHLLKEQTTTQYPPGQGPASAAPPFPAATTNRQGTVTPSTGVVEEITIAGADWGIQGFNPPTVRSSRQFKPEAGGTLDPVVSSWTTAYDTYLDMSTGCVGKTLLVFKDKSLDTRNIVERIQVASSFTTGNGVYIWSSAQTRNYDTATNTMVVAANAVPLPADEPSSQTGKGLDTYEIDGETGLVQATLQIVPYREEYYRISLPTVIPLKLIKDGDLPYNSTRLNSKKEYTINSSNEVRKKGQLIGYTPASAYYTMPLTLDGYGFTLATGKSVPVQDTEVWYNAWVAADKKKR